jgi:putative hydrolase of the HAD superfamily
MAIRAVVFDIGGVLKYSPRLGIDEKWEQGLGLKSGELNERRRDVWRGGSIGTMTEADVHKKMGDIMGMSEAQVNAFMDDVWKEYLGTLNVELTDYFRGLRSQYKTGIISNSFVGAREREMAAYHFDEMTDVIVYSHEVGVAKPDRRIYELACEKMVVQPAEMIFLDDVEVNIAAACELGIHGIVFKYNAQAIVDIQACLRDHAS